MKQCAFCPRTFKRTEHLNRHERAHDGTKPHVCPICNKGYARSDVLSRHVRNHRAISGEPRAPGTGGGLRESTGEAAAGPSALPIQTPVPHLSPVLSHDGQAALSLPPSETLAQSTSPPAEAPSSVLSQFADAAWSTGGQPPVDPSAFVWDPHLFGDLGFGDMTTDDGLSTFLQFLNTPSQPIPSRSHSVAPGSYGEGRAGTVATFKKGTDVLLDKVSALWPISLEIETLPASRWSDLVLGDNVADRIKGELVEHEGAARLENITVPSSDFLGTSLSFFWTHTHPIIPVLHKSTFAARDHLPMLLLAMCASGASWMGTGAAHDFAKQVFQRILHVRQSLWEGESLTASKRKDMLVAELLTCQYALSRGVKSWLTAASGLFGSMLPHARRLGLFDDLGVTSFFQERDVVETKAELWEEWAEAESCTRLTNAILLMDNLLHTIVRDVQSPISFGQHSIAFPCEDRLFEAATRHDWAVAAGVILKRPLYISQAIRQLFGASPGLSSLPRTQDWWSQQSLLFCIYSYKRCRWMSHFLDNRGLHSRYDEAVLRALKQWHQFYRPSGMVTWPQDDVVDYAWHALSSDMFADLEGLSRAAGREGARVAEQVVGTVIRDWHGTIGSRRALLHASRNMRVLIQHSAVDAVPANVFYIHTAAMFASLVFLFYAFGEEWKWRMASSPPLDPGDTVFHLGRVIDIDSIGVGPTGGPDEAIDPSTLSADNAATVNFLQRGGPCCFDGGEPLHLATARTRALLKHARALSAIALDLPHGLVTAQMITLWADLELALP